MVDAATDTLISNVLLTNVLLQRIGTRLQGHLIGGDRLRIDPAAR